MGRDATLRSPSQWRGCLRSTLHWDSTPPPYTITIEPNLQLHEHVACRHESYIARRHGKMEKSLRVLLFSSIISHTSAGCAYHTLPRRRQYYSVVSAAPILQLESKHWSNEGFQAMRTTSASR